MNEMETIYYTKTLVNLGIEFGETLGEKIRYYRMVSKLTQKELAAKVGVYHGTLLRYENNILRPSSKVLSRLKLLLRADEL